MTKSFPHGKSFGHLKQEHKVSWSCVRGGVNKVQSPILDKVTPSVKRVFQDIVLA